MRLSLRAALSCGAGAAALIWASGAWAQTRNFDVPAGAAVKAIPELARQAGIQIIAPADYLTGVQTPPIKGVFDLHTALSALLNGTGVSIAAEDGRTIVLAAVVDKHAARNATPQPLIKVAQAEPVVPVERLAQVGRVAQAAPTPAPVIAQSAPGTVAPEQVLVTGSLIRGTQAVGVPVTALGNEDFKQTGAITIGDALKSVPSLVVLPSQVSGIAGFNFSSAQNVSIHGIGGNAYKSASPAALLMVDGVRVPVSGLSGKILSPSIMPQLAVERIDVLADGASATYGSDAVSGVINVILRRGFDGAITEFRSSVSTDVGALKLSSSQLFGRTWDGGDVTVSYEYTHQAAVKDVKRSYFTSDFRPWGLDDRRLLVSAAPGIVSIGSPDAPASTPAGFGSGYGSTCNNCYSIPKGQNGVGLTWAQIVANPGTANEYNFWDDAWIMPDIANNSAAFTFDQDIWTGNGLVRRVQFFAEGFYNNRRAIMRNPGGVGNSGENAGVNAIPTTNPYYPVGAPAGLNVAYNLDKEVPSRYSGGALSDRYTAGLNLDLLGGWAGKLSYSKTEENGFDHTINKVSLDRVSAALGYRVEAPLDGTTAPYSKPANVPYLNLFCDQTAFTCNDPVTLAYLGSTWQKNSSLLFNEGSAVFDGPVFDLPGGTVRLAVGTDYLTEHYAFFETTLSQNPTGEITTAGDRFVDADYGAFSVWAAFAQLNVPLIGPNNQIPLVESLELELSGRYDHYSNVGSTKNPKVGVNWTVGAGLSLRGSWGTSFRAPAFSETSAVSGATLHPVNVKGGDVSDVDATCSSVGGKPVPGSAGAILNPNCEADLIYPGGLLFSGGSGIATVIRGGSTAIQPQTAINWNLGFTFAPTEFLKGLVLDATVWSVKEKGVITQKYCGDGLSDPLAVVSGCMILPDNPNFAQYVAATLKNPFFHAAFIPDPANISFIADSANTNAGSLLYQGIDFDARYDWDMGDFGAWNVGVNGTYNLEYQRVILEGQPVADGYKGKDSGGRLRYRTSLGWTGGEDGAWSITGFMNYFPHFGYQEAGDVGFRNTPKIPSCFLDGNPSCASYGPNFAQYTQQYPSLYNGVPAWIRFDISIGYTTGDRPANEYLRNLSFQFTVNNILNKHPNFAYLNATSGTLPFAFDPNEDPLQRVVSLVIRKDW